MPVSTWPSQMVSMPRSGLPKARWMDTSINSSEMPITTSGITSGALTMPENKVRPLKRRYLTMAKAASTTSSSEMVNVSSQAENSACVIIGKVTRRNTWLGRAPRSMAASSSCGLRSCRRA